MPTVSASERQRTKYAASKKPNKKKPQPTETSVLKTLTPKRAWFGEVFLAFLNGGPGGKQKTQNTPNHGRKQKEKETNLCLTKQSHAIKMMDVLVPGVEFETSCWEKGSPENKLPNYFLQPDF